MKKAINKTERDFIVQGIAVKAASKGAQDIVNKLGKLRQKLSNLLLSTWEDAFPGISRADQLALIQSEGARHLEFRPPLYIAVTDKEGAEPRASHRGEFGKIHWSNTGTDATKQRIARLASQIIQSCSGTAGVLVDGVSNCFTSSLSLNSNHRDIIAGSQALRVYLGDAPTPEGTDLILNSKLSLIHKEAAALLEELRALIFATEDAYQAVFAALVPVKSVEQLVELMPEAVEHFPPSVTYVRPTKEIADPKAINDIRAKLAKGLPI